MVEDSRFKVKECDLVANVLKWKYCEKSMTVVYVRYILLTMYFKWRDGMHLYMTGMPYLGVFKHYNMLLWIFLAYMYTASINLTKNFQFKIGE